MLFIGLSIVALLLFLAGLHTPAMIAVLIGAVVQSIPRRFTFGELTGKPKSKWMSRAEAEAWLQNYEKEQGYLPYSPVELAQMEAEERYTHDRNSESGAFWAGGNTYVDSYGHAREVGSNQLVR
jgi:hypothetical protein